MQRLINAFFNSVRAFRRLAESEKAFQQELLLLVLSLPIALVVAKSWSGFALLIGALLALMMVEVLNTGIEAVCDAVTPQFDKNIQLAKDCGSLAVLIAAIIAMGIWGIALAEWLG